MLENHPNLSSDSPHSSTGKLSYVNAINEDLSGRRLDKAVDAP
jgi:hypothetical protein